MDSDAYGDGYHEAFKPDGVEDVGAKKEREPQHGEDVSIYLPWSEQIPEYCKSKKPQQK